MAVGVSEPFSVGMPELSIVKCFVAFGISGAAHAMRAHAPSSSQEAASALIKT